MSSLPMRHLAGTVDRRLAHMRAPVRGTPCAALAGLLSLAACSDTPTAPFRPPVVIRPGAPVLITVPT
ncbi:MAG TPA: hypothetical protein VFY16_13700 [Gemmatimonadaceae bacterium]|nr:hypothetical protein [Gemmatimonadaceae bacterium]